MFMCKYKNKVALTSAKIVHNYRAKKVNELTFFVAFFHSDDNVQ